MARDAIELRPLTVTLDPQYRMTASIRSSRRTSADAEAAAAARDLPMSMRVLISISGSNRKDQIKVATIDRMVSGYLATREQRRLLKEIASTHDFDGDGYLNRSEFESMLRELRENEDFRELYKIFVAIPERYGHKPGFTVLTAGVIFVICLYHTLHYHYHPEHAGKTGDVSLWEGAFPHCSVLIFDCRRRAQLWRYFSYAYAHKGFSHCLKNIAILLVVGAPLEMCHGWVRVGAVWVVGALGAVLSVSIFDSQSDLAGASGACFALIGAHFASVILNWREDAIARTDTIPWTRRRVKKLQFNVYRIIKIVLFGGYVLAEITYGTCKYLSKRKIHNCTLLGLDGGSLKDDPTSFTAHFSGLAVGLCFGVVVLQNRNVVWWETRLRAACGILLLCAAITALTINVTSPSFIPYWKQENGTACHHNVTTQYDIWGVGILLSASALVCIPVCAFVFCFALRQAVHGNG